MSKRRTVVVALAVLVLSLFVSTGVAQAIVIDRVSVDSSGTQANDASTICSVSADGRYVAFVSYATNLVAGDTNNCADVFVRDRDTGITTRVSVNSGGTQGNQYSSGPVISADGRYVAFSSWATNLVAGDSNDLQDVFVYDRDTGITIRVSVSDTEAQGNQGSWTPSISADGRYVAFTSGATNLVTGDTNAEYDVFVRDLQLGTTQRVSVSSTGAQAAGASSSPYISPDGRYVAFVSIAANLVTGDTNSKTDIFVRDRTAGTTERVSVADDESQAVLESDTPSISSDGRYVAFGSYAWNLITNDWNGTWDVFVRDRVAGTTELASQSSAGAMADYGARYAGNMSADGRYVCFCSESSYLVPGDTNGSWDYFVRDRLNGLTTLVSLTSGGSQGVQGTSSQPVITPDGLYVVFSSEASNLVSYDSNDRADAFVARADWTPVITGLSPSIGSVGGKDVVTITGNCFIDVTSITFDGAPATDFTVVNPSRIDAIAPAHAPGTVQVQVTAGGVPTADISADNFTYTLPTIISVVPNHGSTAGGTVVVITGSYLTGTSAVTFGGEPALGYTIDSGTKITATAPAHDPGLVQVQVQAGDYSTSDAASDNYTYYVPPTITGIDPVSGPVTGGTVVTITGTDFDGISGPGGVTFGGKNALSYTVDSPTQVTATSPYHAAGLVQVVVTNGGGPTEDSPNDDFTFIADPVADLQAHERVSVDSAEVEGDLDSGIPAVSADGRYVAFMSDAPNLVLGDTNAVLDVFVRDRATGTTERVSVATDGTQGDQESGNPAISADGRYVAFWSDAGNLVPGDSNFKTDIFVYDRQTGSTERVSVSSAGVQGNYDSSSVAISSDGRYVAFSSVASNFATGDVSSTWDIFVHDRQAHTTEMVSVSSSEVRQNSDCDFVSISGDGRYVAFDSDATNLVTNGWDDVWDVFVRDRQLGTTERVSVNSSGSAPNDGSGYPCISADGRYVFFESWASDLVSGDTNEASDIFVRDRTGGTTTRLSVSSAGAQGDDLSISCSVSADGRYVAFESNATNLVAGDTNDCADIFVRDRTSGTTRRVSRDAAGVEGDYESYWPSISADGTYIAFSSVADNLVPGDTNFADDVFAVLTPMIPSYGSLRGTDRFDTAIKISQAMFPPASYPDGLPADSGVVLAPGWESFQEALCGAPLAAAWGGPVLLSSKTQLYTAVKDELVRLGPDRVFLIGLTGTSVADAVKAVLPSATVTPINGTSVYHLSYLVAKQLEARVEGKGGDMSDATGIVTIGTTFPDAIGVSPLACSKQWPVLFTDYPDNKPMNAYAVQAMNELGITSYVKAGTYAPDPTGITGLTNFSGTDRYVTNQKVASWAFTQAGLTFTHTGLTTGDKFPDALAGGPYLALDHGTLLLSPLTGPLPPGIATLIATHAAEVQHFTFIAMIEPVVGAVKALLP